MPATVRPNDYPDIGSQQRLGNRFAEGKTPLVLTASTPGDTQLALPAPGKRLRLYWVGLSTSEAAGGETRVRLRFQDGPLLYSWWMGSPGAFSHWQTYEGQLNKPLLVNLTAGISVEVNLTIEELGS